MATTASLHPNPYATTHGTTVPQILALDEIPAPDHYLEPSYLSLGTEDISIDRYLTREWHDREVEKVWKKVWQIAAREEDISNPGDYIVYTIADDSVLVARQSDGSVEAYINACLHRGNELCVGQGNAKAFRCPFHGFTWSLDGKLKMIPGEWDFPQIDKAAFSLPKVKVGTWGGFVFINLDPEAGPLEDYLELLPTHLDGEGLAARYKAAHVSQVVSCNWKVLQEAFIEGYHVAETHFDKDEEGVFDIAGLPAFVNDTAIQYDAWPDVRHIDRLVLVHGVPSQHVAHRVNDEQAIVDGFLRRYPAEARPVVQSGERARDVLATFFRKALSALHRTDLSNASSSDVLDQIQYNIFPNFTVWPTIVAPLCYRFRPYGNDPDKSIFEVWLLYPRPDGGEQPAVAQEDRLAEGEAWATRAELGVYGPVIDQDMPNLPRIQRGLKATRKPGITLGNYQEIRIRRFHKILEEYLAQ